MREGKGEGARAVLTVSFSLLARDRGRFRRGTWLPGSRRFRMAALHPCLALVEQLAAGAAPKLVQKFKQRTGKPGL